MSSTIEVGECCFCKEECNPASQSCGLCMRNADRYHLRMTTFVNEFDDLPDLVDDDGIIVDDLPIDDLPELVDDNRNIVNDLPDLIDESGNIVNEFDDLPDLIDEAGNIVYDDVTAWFDG